MDNEDWTWARCFESLNTLTAFDFNLPPDYSPTPMSATAKKKKKKPKKEEKKKKGNTKAGAATTKRPKTPDTDTDVSGEIKLARLAQPIDVHTGENDEPEATPEGEPQSTKNLGSGRKYALKRSAALLFALQHTDFYFTCIDPVNKLPYISIVPASEPLVEHLLNNPVLESTVPSNIVTLIKTGLVLHDNLGSIRVVDESDIHFHVFAAIKEVLNAFARAELQKSGTSPRLRAEYTASARVVKNRDYINVRPDMGLAFDPRPHRDTERNKPVADDCRCTRLTSLSLAEFKSFKILHDKVLDEMNKFYDIKGKARAFILQGGFVQFLFDVDLGLYGIDRNFLEVGLSLALDNGGYSSVLQTTFVPVSNGNAYFLADWYAPQGVVRNTAPYGSGRHSQDPEEPTKQYRRGNLAHAMAAMALATLKTGFKGIPDYGYVEDPLAQLRDAPHLEELALTSSTEGEIVFYSSSEDEDPGTTDSLLSGDRSVTRERATFAAVQSDPPKPTTRSMTRAAAAAAAGPSEPSGPSEEQQGGAVELEYEGDTEDDAEGHVYEQDGPDHDGMMDMD